MFPVSETIFLREKNWLSSHSGHRTAAEIDDTGKPENCVLLPFFLYQLTCGACSLSGGGMLITLAPCLSGRGGGYV